MNTEILNHEVSGLGQVNNATFNASGALMDMLASTYSRILLAAIRESIQNACDAAGRKGLSLSEGVKVTMPSQDNPYIEVRDFGHGMSKDFMESTYLSFGSSTKRDDEDQAGGLGVGRWAAYGYGKECSIATTDEAGKEHTFFQFQNEEGIPAVQLAGIRDNSQSGTVVSFPVQESDIREAYFAVAYLKAIMQLTLEDSFSIEGGLPEGMEFEIDPELILNLGEEDEGLEGIRVFLTGATSGLQYRSNRLDTGSLIVLTNEDKTLGGLPFNVDEDSEDFTPFTDGCIIDIPMKFKVPFMPSREEVKNTPALEALKQRITQAAYQCAIKKAESLYNCPSLVSKRELTKFLGGGRSQHTHFMKDLNFRYDIEEPLVHQLRSVLGGSSWRNRLDVTSSLIDANEERITFHTNTDKGGLTRLATDTTSSGLTQICLTVQGKAGSGFKIIPDSPITLIKDDLKVGGAVRVRHWLKSVDKESSILFVTGEIGLVEEVVADLTSQFNNELELIATSDLFNPTKNRPKATKPTLTYFDVRQRKQVRDARGWEDSSFASSRFIYIEKNGSEAPLFGDTPFSETVSRFSNLPNMLAAMGIPRLWLLTSNQLSSLKKAQESLDLYEDEEVGAISRWIPLEQAMIDALDFPTIAPVIKEGAVLKLRGESLFERFLGRLAARPLFELKDTPLDAALSPYLDILTGEINMEPDNFVKLGYDAQTLIFRLSRGIQEFEENLVPQELLDALTILENATLDYSKIMEGWYEQFPLIEYLSSHEPSQAQFDDLIKAMSILYR